MDISKININRSFLDANFTALNIVSFKYLKSSLIKMISKTKIKSRIRKKTNPELAETIKQSVKNSNWLKIARMLSSPKVNYSKINLFQIDKNTTAGDTIVVPGKILSQGELTKKIKICALSISKQAKEKLKTTKSEFSLLINEIKNNPKAEGIRVIK